MLNRDPLTSEIKYIENQLNKDDIHIEGTNIKIFSNRVFFGKVIALPDHAEFRYTNLLADLIEATGPYDAIIELGCGYGRNLLELFYGGGPRDAKYIGGEFTNSGVEIATELAKHASNMNAEFFHFNHLEPKLPFAPFKRAFVFTCHSIEQVMQISDVWFDEVVKAGEFVRGAHLEPFGFQIKHLSELSNQHQEMMMQFKWNLNFAQVFHSAIKRKVIKDEQIFLEAGIARDVNVGSLAFWVKA